LSDVLISDGNSQGFWLEPLTLANGAGVGHHVTLYIPASMLGFGIPIKTLQVGDYPFIRGEMLPNPPIAIPVPNQFPLLPVEDEVQVALT